MALRKVFFKQHTFQIAYTKIDNNASKNILFLHGWGSNKDVMQRAFGDYFKAFNHFYIDLPGFGNSPNDVVLTTIDYAHIINAFITALNIEPNVIVGHSFGGKVAMLCQGKKVILLSSAGIVTKKSLVVCIKIALAKITKKLHLTLPFLRSSDAKSLNGVMYEIFKGVVNEDFSNIFGQSKKDVSIFWGLNDNTTPLSSGEKIASLIPNSRFFALEGGHYFFLQHPATIESLYNDPNITLHILVFGKVQGVGYRKFAKALAEELGITGSTQNLLDGSVEIFASGKEEILSDFSERLKTATTRSRVSKLRINRIMYRPYSEFEILT